MNRTFIFLVAVSAAAIGFVSEPSAFDRVACSGKDCARCHQLTADEASAIVKPLNVTVQSITHAPIQGMFEVLAKRDEQQGLIYVDYAKKHIMQGVVVNIATREAVSSHVKELPAPGK